MSNHKKPRTNSKPGSQSLPRWLALALAVVITLIGGALYGSYSQRWGPPADLVAAGAHLAEMPDQIGRWTLVEELPIEEDGPGNVGVHGLCQSSLHPPGFGRVGQRGHYRRTAWPDCGTHAGNLFFQSRLRHPGPAQGDRDASRRQLRKQLLASGFQDQKSLCRRGCACTTPGAAGTDGKPRPHRVTNTPRHRCCTRSNWRPPSPANAETTAPTQAASSWKPSTNPNGP